MSISRIEPGDVLRLETTITDVDGNPGDPTELTFTMNPPGGDAEASAWPSGDEIQRESAGRFYFDFPVTSAGTHRYQWLASGTNASVAEGSFIAHALRVVPATP